MVGRGCIFIHKTPRGSRESHERTRPTLGAAQPGATGEVLAVLRGKHGSGGGHTHVTADQVKNNKISVDKTQT